MGNDIKPVEKPLSGRIATSLAAAVPAGGISYMSGRIFAKWGVLDAPADWIGEYLRVHVPPGTAGWVLGFLIFVILYGLILWKVWGPRHIHHLPVPHETAPVATSTRDFIPAAGIGSKAAPAPHDAFESVREKTLRVGLELQEALSRAVMGDSSLRPPSKPAAPPPRDSVRRVRGYDLSDASLDGLERVTRALESRKRKRTFTEFVLGIHPEVEQLRATQSAGMDRSSQAGDEDRHYREALAKLEAPARARAAMLARKMGAQIGDPVALGEHLLEQDAREAAREAKKDQRRALIAGGRDMVVRYRAEQPSIPFETWARRQREYLDLQPHFGAEYDRLVARNADRDSSLADGDFLRELVRLEKEWDLV
jgi:hypothetical protein